MPVKTHEWSLLLDRPALRQAFDALPGYCWPAPVRTILCQQHQLTDAEFTALLRLYARACRPSGRHARPGRPRGPQARNGLDLLLSLPRLRAMLDASRPVPPLEPRAVAQLRERFRLSAAELVGVLNAYADLLARP